MTRVTNGRRRCCRSRRPTFRAQLRRVALVGALPVLLTTLSCGGDGGTLAPTPPEVPRPPEPTRADLTVDPTSVREDAGATTLTVTATLVGEGTRTTATAIALTVDEGTATAADYTATQANLMIAAGRTSGTATLTLTPVSDAVLEGAETVTVNGTAAGLTVRGVEVTINDPRPPEPTRADLTVDPTSVREDAGATTLTVTATLVGEGTRTTATAIALTVDEGTATAADYTATQANLMIAAGRTSGTATLTLTPVSDAVLEGAETVTVNGTAAGLTVRGVEVTINDPPVVVFFSMDRLEVPEGESRDVTVHYQVADLPTTLDLGISFLAGSASEADFETSAESVRIPAGRLMSGQVEVSLTARTDPTVTEGAETVIVRFIPPSGIEASLVLLGQELEVVILDRGRPCPGVTVWGDPPEWRNSVARTTLFMEWENGSGGGFDWAGPYYDDEEDPDDRSRSPLLEVNIAEWRVDLIEEVIRHTLEIEWPVFLPANLVFRSDTGTCELPALVCRVTGCTVNS